jgi:two-component system, cell cycle sensor histidine kinase and response regulator CckA
MASMTQHQGGDLPRSEDLLRIMVETLPDYAIFALDMEGRVVSWNRGGERLFGYAEEEIIMRGVETLFTPEDIERGVPACQLERALAEGRDSDDRWLVRKDGTRFWASCLTIPLRDEASGWRGVVKVVHELAERKPERKRDDQILSEQPDFTEAILEMTGSLIIVLDGEGRIRRFNQACQQLTGYTLEEVQERRFWELFTLPEEVDRYQSVFAHPGSTSFSSTHESLWVTKDGRKRLIAWSNSPLMNNRGEAEYIIVTGIDVTEQREAEAALRRSEEQYRLLFETNPHPMWVYDPHTLHFLAVNDAAIHTYGYTRAEFLQMTIKDIRPPEEVPNLMKGLTDSSVKFRHRGEWRHRKKDGTVIDVDITWHEIVFNGRKARLTMAQDITLRKRLEQSLRASEERFRSLAEGNMAGVFLADLEGKLLYVNDAFLRITGYSRTEFEAGLLPWNTLTPPEWLAVDERAIAQARARGASDPYEKEYVRKDGERVFVLVAAARIEANGQEQLIGTTFDITKRKRAEESLRESQERLRLLTDQLPAVIWSTDLDLCFTYSAGAGLRFIAGTPGEEDNCLSLFEYFGTDDPNFKPIANHLRALKGESVAYEMDWMGRTFDAHVEPLRDPQGEIIGCIGIALDVTERKEMGEALRKSEEQFRAVFEQSGIGIALGDMQGRLLEVNPALGRMLGYNREELKGTHFAEITYPEDLGKDEALFREMLEGKHKHYQIEKRYLRKDGEIIWGNLNASLIHDADGKVVYGIATVADITQRKMVEEALRESEERYRRLIELSPQAIFVHSEGHITFVNEAGVRLLGAQSSDQLMGMTSIDFVAAEEQEGAAEEIRRMLERGESSPLREGQLRRLDGSLVDVEVAAIPFTYHGKPAVQTIVRDITVRKRAQAQLIRISRAIEGTSDAIRISDPDLRSVYHNPAFIKLFGYTAEELNADGGFTTLFIDQELAGDLRDIIMSGKPWKSRVEMRARDGRLITAELSADAIRDEAGNIIGRIGIYTDVTERRRAEEILHFRAHLLDAVEQAVITTDTSGTITYWNRFAERLYGWTAEEILGHNIIEVTPTLQTQTQARDIMAALVRGESWSGVFDVRRKDGTFFPAMVTDTPIFNEQGELVGIVGVSVDITERQQIEDALRRSEEEYRGLVENAKDMIVILDLEGNLTSANKTALQLTGYTLEEALKLNFMQVVAPESLEHARRMLASKISGETEQTIYELEIIAKDGKRISLDVSSWLVYKDGVPMNVQAIGRDVTERKHLEQQLLQAQKMEAVGRLAGGVAHDFNNLLTAITMSTDIAIRKLGPADQVRRHIEEIRKAAERAASLTRQLLAFSRKQILQPKVIDLNYLVEDSTNMLRRLIGEDIEVHTKLEPGLDRVLADPWQIEQVLMNLMVNARDAMPGGGRIIIETASVYLDEEYSSLHLAAQSGHYVMLAVSDTGCGMDEATRARIFEPFFTTKEVGKGTGLGLSTVYGIIKQSGGYIWVYSELGIGTTFKIYLPRIKRDVEMEEAIESDAKTARALETVLLVEDEAVLRNLAQEILEMSGYRVLLAATGAEALRISEQYAGEVHILLTDVVMPGMSGPELETKLKAQRPAIKVLFMSGYTDEAIVQHGVLNENVDFIQKPFTAISLIKKIREVLDKLQPRGI